MTRDRTREQTRRDDLKVMSDGDAKHWYQPRTLLSVAAQPNQMWLQGRIWTRPGDAPGRGPVHVIGRAADYANYGITARLTPVLGFLGAQGFLCRSWTVAHSWYSTSNQHADLVELLPALFGYATDEAVEKMRQFAWDRGYGFTDRLVAPTEAGKSGPAPHQYVGGELRPSGLLIGTQRTSQDLSFEWAGCNPAALDEIQNAYQVTVYETQRGTGNQLWADLAGHFGAHYQENYP